MTEARSRADIGTRQNDTLGRRARQVARSFLDYRHAKCAHILYDSIPTSLCTHTPGLFRIPVMIPAVEQLVVFAR